MADDRDEDIRARAHALWEAEGRPEGREQDHWLQAQRELAEELGQARETGRTIEPAPGGDPTTPVAPRASRKAKAPAAAAPTATVPKRAKAAAKPAPSA